MPFGYAGRLNPFPMFFGRIALIGVPPIVWGFAVKCIHKIISFGFCQYRGSRDVEKSRIAFDHAFVRDIEIRCKAVAIHEYIFRSWLELLNGEMHRFD